jgi:hypothetical protein
MATIGPTARAAGARVVVAGAVVVVARVVVVAARVVTGAGRVEEVARSEVVGAAIWPSDEHATSASTSALAAANDLPQPQRLFTPP